MEGRFCVSQQDGYNSCGTHHLSHEIGTKKPLALTPFFTDVSTSDWMSQKCPQGTQTPSNSLKRSVKARGGGGGIYLNRREHLKPYSCC